MKLMVEIDTEDIFSRNSLCKACSLPDIQLFELNTDRAFKRISVDEMKTKYNPFLPPGAGGLSDQNLNNHFHHSDLRKIIELYVNAVKEKAPDDAYGQLLTRIYNTAIGKDLLNLDEVKKDALQMMLSNLVKAQEDFDITAKMLKQLHHAVFESNPEKVYHQLQVAMQAIEYAPVDKKLKEMEFREMEMSGILHAVDSSTYLQLAAVSKQMWDHFQVLQDKWGAIVKSIDEHDRNLLKQGDTNIYVYGNLSILRDHLEPFSEKVLQYCYLNPIFYKSPELAERFASDIVGFLDNTIKSVIPDASSPKALSAHRKN
jgi:hypothetical protein